MDSKRFDNWTRNRALRLSRRDTLRLAGAGGATVAIAALAPRTLAQATCSYTLHGQTSGGPSAPATYEGTLAFTVGADGHLSQGTFTRSGGQAAPVSGAVTGRAIDLLIDLGSGQSLSLSGAASQPFPTCPNAAGGVLSGPQPGDLGAWEATGGGSAGGASASGSTSSGSGASGGSGQSSLNCPPPQTDCGQNCCPGGATCTDVNLGLCACPSGTEQCGTRCVPSCADGQLLDLDTCTCPGPAAACIQNQQACQSHGQCCSGYCGGGTCFDCAGKVCGDFGCIDPSRDNLNCGNCGNVCVAPQVCAGGICGCGPDDTPCVDHSECCSQLCSFGTCTTCSDILSSGPGAPSAPSTFCAAGVCVDLRIDINHCGLCFNSCPRTSGGIVCDAGVCHDINNDADYCGFLGEACAPGQICHLGDCINA